MHEGVYTKGFQGSCNVDAVAGGHLSGTSEQRDGLLLQVASF
jgi:hypothetical protein